MSFLEDIVPFKKGLAWREALPKVIEAYVYGSDMTTACANSGITLGDFYRALLAFPDLRDIYLEAKAIHNEVLRAKLHAVVEGHATSEDPKSVDSAKWLLERMFNKEYNTRHVSEREEVKRNVVDMLTLKDYEKEPADAGLPEVTE